MTGSSKRNLILLTFLAALALGCAGYAGAATPVESSLVDTFAAGRWRIEVRFFDPTTNIYSMYPQFDLQDSTVTTQGRSDMWADYMHRSPLYLFTAIDDEGASVRHFCMRGDPEVRDSARYYKVEVATDRDGAAFNPAADDSVRIVDETIRPFPVGGSLFEHMAAFQRPENVPLIGNGVLFLGYYCRVTPYLEVKDAMLQIIESTP